MASFPLPKSDVLGVEPQFNADDFLDKLARMKGRLLKGGEPHIEGVAKIVPSDWVRGGTGTLNLTYADIKQSNTVTVWKLCQ
jgi:ribosome biogenesis GTPase A